MNESLPEGLEAASVSNNLSSVSQRSNGELLEFLLHSALELPITEQQAYLQSIKELTRRLELGQPNTFADNAYTFMQALLHEGSFQQVLNTAYEGILMFDQEGIVTYVNTRGAEILGYTPKEAFGHSFLEFLHSEETEKAKKNLERNRNGEPNECEYVLRHKNGDRVWVISFASPIYDDQGQFAGGLVLFIDVTERRLAMQVLKDSEKRFHTVLSAVPISVFTMDRELRYTWIYHMPHGLTPGDVIGKRDDEFHPADKVNELIALKKLVIKTGRPMQREIHAQMNGKFIYFLITLEPLFDEQGSVSGLTGAALDITRQRRLEAEHREATVQMEVQQQLSELQRKLAEFREKERQEIAREIHDGPIQRLVGMLFDLQIARETIQEESALALISQISANLKATIQGLRESIYELRPPALIRYGLARAIQIHAEDFRTRNPGIKVELDLVEDENLLSDETCLALYRIYQEALNNIVRHAGADQVLVRYSPRRNLMVLEITDNGRGFTPPSNLLSLAEANHFGLAGMFERMEAIGGTFKITALPGQGTTIEAAAKIK